MSQAKMVGWVVGGLAAVLLMLLYLNKFSAPGDGDELQAQAGGYQLRLLFAEPVTAGGNALNVRVLDSTGWPVKDARIEVMAMPAANPHQHHAGMAGMEGMDMAGMEGMDSAAPEMGGHSMSHTQTVFEANTAPGMAGDYAGQVRFPSKGHWLLNTQVTVNGQTYKADIGVTVAERPAPVTIIAFFIALNVFILWAAAISRRNNPRLVLTQAETP